MFVKLPIGSEPQLSSIQATVMVRPFIEQASRIDLFEGRLSFRWFRSTRLGM